MSWQSYGDLAFYALAGVTVVFSFAYLFLAPWYRTATGRNIMAVMGSLAAALAYFAWVIANKGVPAGFYPARALLFTALFAAVAWRLWLFVRHQLLHKGSMEAEDEKVR
jgi:hypothetical protein